jgi:AmiR/NasT family two-component response regulator
MGASRRSTDAGTCSSRGPVRPGAQGPAATATVRPARILLCEADTRAAQTARAALEAAGYAVSLAPPRDATDPSIEVDPPDFALLDIRSSSFDPTGLAARLAAARIPFVLTSAADDATMVHRAIDSGAIGCFFKPLDISALVPAIPVWIARAAELNRLADVERSLRDALQSSRSVSTAVGILMERSGLDAQEAFEALRRQARHDRLSVQRLAARIVGGRAAIADPPAYEARKAPPREES